MALVEHNYTHENENWRQRVSKEQKASKEFTGLYDYMVWKHTPTHLSRPSVPVKVKYYKPRGQEWTVTDKRIPVVQTREARADNLSVPEAEAVLGRAVAERTAVETCRATHTLVKQELQDSNPLYRTSASTIGKRHSLEMFGVDGYGRLAVRTKEPVGTGTKIYTT